MLKPKVSRLSLDSVLREHLLYQFEDYLDIQDFYHVLDDLLVNVIFHGSIGKIIILLFWFLKIGIKCHFLIIQFQEFSLDVRILLKVLLHKLKGLFVPNEQMLGGEVVNKVQVERVLSNL